MEQDVAVGGAAERVVQAVVSNLVKLILYLIETPFNAFANRADPDQAALLRAA